MRNNLVALSFSLVVFVTGCGGGDGPTSVVNKYHQAIIDKDIDAVMACMVADANRKTTEALLEFRSSGMKRGGLPEVLEEKITGDTAVVTCKFGPSKQDVKLIKENGKWKVK